MESLAIHFTETQNDNVDKRRFTLTIANTGATHYLPTGTPDRHLTIRLRVLDKQGKILSEENHTLKRTIMWRPFIVDLWDTRLPRDEQRQYSIDVSKNSMATASMIDAEVRYHLLDEDRRKRIGYKNMTPINYSVFQQQLPISTATP